MITAFATLLIIGLFAPLLLWWIRNLSRVLSRKDINIISDNLFRIFFIGFGFALINGLLLGLAVAGLI